MKIVRCGLGAAMFVVCVVQANGQTAADFATNNELFLETAGKALKWEEPTAPVKIVGPLYLQSDLSFSQEETARRITWLTEIDTENVWDDFTRKIDLRGQAR